MCRRNRRRPDKATAKRRNGSFQNISYLMEEAKLYVRDEMREQDVAGLAEHRVPQATLQKEKEVPQKGWLAAETPASGTDSRQRPIGECRRGWHLGP